MSILDIIVESSMKLFVMNNKIKFVILGMLLYSLQPVLFAQVLRIGHYGIGETNIRWNVLSSIIVAVFGVAYFNEKLSKIQIIGIVLGIIALTLIDYPTK
jgi:multidrug transporter EmrE-like cation transporter